MFNYTDRVYKFHGDIKDIDNCVITRDDYRNYPKTHQMFNMSLSGELATKTFLFLGYSFQDPDFEELISSLSTIMNGRAREHYYLEVLTKKPSRKEHYINLKKKIAAKDRERFGIKTIWLDSYDNIPTILEMISIRNSTRYIWLSGSNRENPSGWTDEMVHKFLYELGGALVNADYHVSTGLIDGMESFGQGMISEANKNSEDSNKFFSYQRLPHYKNEFGLMRSVLNDEESEIYKHKMLRPNGIVLHLFGNQTYDNGRTYQPAKGVIDEFDIAQSLNKYAIAVPQTGGASYVIFKRMLNDIEKFPYMEPLMKDSEIFKKENIDSLVETVLKIISHIHLDLSIF